ncbi:recombinase family protein [Streptomyces noursei]|uniref:recombinase family protein n=1 Tax=Streptomyces noursei TaxID=1971 RepID=UPI000C9C3E87
MAAGRAARALAREYNSAGMRTATGKDFTAGMVRDIVDNPVYEGCKSEAVARVRSGDRHTETTKVTRSALLKMWPA